jgi:hypothetical protein
LEQRSPRLVSRGLNFRQSPSLATVASFTGHSARTKRESTVDTYQQRVFLTLTILALLASIATLAGAKPRCIYITEGDGTFVAVCGQ